MNFRFFFGEYIFPSKYTCLFFSAGAYDLCVTFVFLIGATKWTQEISPSLVRNRYNVKIATRKQLPWMMAQTDEEKSSGRHAGHCICPVCFPVVLSLYISTVIHREQMPTSPIASLTWKNKPQWSSYPMPLYLVVKTQFIFPSFRRKCTPVFFFFLLIIFTFKNAFSAFTVETGRLTSQMGQYLQKVVSMVLNMCRQLEKDLRHKLIL